MLEPDGTDAMVAWFQQERDQLTITVDMLVETLRSNPYDWIVTHREAQHLPVSYPEAEARSLAGCLQDRADPEVRAWAQAIADRVDGSATAFLSALADEIHHGFHHVGRLEGSPRMLPRPSARSPGPAGTPPCFMWWPAAARDWRRGS